MNQLLSYTRLPVLIKRSVLFKDAIIAMGWAFLLGIPLFIVHMMLFDFEHGEHMGNTYSFIQSITDTIPDHPISLALWLLAIFIAAFAIRRTFQQQVWLIRAQEKLEVSHTQAFTDGLTGVWNRAGFEQLLEVTIKRSRDKNRPFSIILGDVDGLKNYNDTYGHPAADEALKQVVQVLTDQSRTSDEIARYGGDEFALFCFDIDQYGAEILITRLREAFSVTPLSMSFGSATYPFDGQDRKTLIEKADMKLYQAKENTLSHDRNIVDCQCEECGSKNVIRSEK